MRKTRPFFYCILALLLFFTFSGIGGCDGKSQSKAGAPLIAAFSSGCTSYGPYSQQALAQTQSLIGILEDLKNKDRCQPLAVNLAAIQSLQREIFQLSSQSQYGSYRENERAFFELTLLLGGRYGATNDPEMYAALRAALVETQVELALLKGSARLERYQLAMAGLSSAIQAVTLQARDLQGCLRDYPEVALQLASSAMAIGGGFLTPALGLTVSSVGSLFGAAVEYARTRGDEDTIWQLYQNQMPTALTCGLETMAQAYCQASDTLQILKLQKKAYPEPSGKPSSFWIGMDLLNRRLPALQGWIYKLKTGVPPTSPEDAGKIDSAWRKVFELEMADIRFQGYLNQAVREYEQTASDDTRRKIITDLLSLVSSSIAPPDMCSGCSTGPLFDFQDQGYVWACWLTHGYREVNEIGEMCPALDSGKQTLKGYVGEILAPKADIYRIYRNWQEVLGRVSDFVNLRFSQSVSLSAHALLDSASYPTFGSPIETFYLILDFLDHVEARSEKFQFREQLTESLRRTVVEVISILETKDVDQTALDRVQQLYDVLDLKRSSRKFLDELVHLISADIEYSMRYGEFPIETQEIIKASGIEVRDRLRSAGINRIGDAVEDLNNARATIRRNIELFRNHFKRSLGRSVIQLSKQTARQGPIAGEKRRGVDRPAGQSLAKLCLLIATTGADYPDDRTKYLCYAHTLESFYGKNGNLKINLHGFEKSLRGKSFSERVCTYHRFKRQERIAETLDKSLRRSTL